MPVSNEQIWNAARELYAAGPWGEPFAFENDGTTLVSDAHSLETYAEMVKVAAPHLEAAHKVEGEATRRKGPNQPSDDAQSQLQSQKEHVDESEGEGALRELLAYCDEAIELGAEDTAYEDIAARIRSQLNEEVGSDG